jgi:hypothetical protein
MNIPMMSDPKVVILVHLSGALAILRCVTAGYAETATPLVHAFF